MLGEQFLNNCFFSSFDIFYNFINKCNNSIYHWTSCKQREVLDVGAQRKGNERRKWKKEMENIMDNISFLCYLHQANHPYMIKNHPMNHWYTSSLSLGIKTIIRYLPTIPVWNNALNLTHLLMKWVLMKYLFVISKDQQQIKIKTSIYPKYFVFGFNSFDPFFPSHSAIQLWETSLRSRPVASANPTQPNPHIFLLFLVVKLRGLTHLIWDVYDP